MVLHPSSVWHWFESLTGQANAASLVGFFLSIATISVSVFGWYKSKLNRLEVDRRELLEERARKDDKIARLGRHIADLERQHNDARARHPETALQLAEREWANGNFWLGHKALEAWLIAEGTIIAPILLRRALLESAAAIGEQRMSHLAAAQAYAIGALSLAPRNPESATVLTEIESAIADSAEEAAPLTACLGVPIENWTGDLTNDGEDNAHALVAEGNRHEQTGYYNLAKASVELAVQLFSSALGARARHTAGAESYLATLYAQLGLESQAIVLLEKALSTQQALAGLGLTHSETLTTRARLARILPASESTLAMAVSVLRDFMAEPSIGPDHVSAYSMRYGIASILDSLGRYTEARDALVDLTKHLRADIAYESLKSSELTCCDLLMRVAMKTGDIDLAVDQFDILNAAWSEDTSEFRHPVILGQMTDGARTILEARPEIAINNLLGIIQRELEHPALGRLHVMTIKSHVVLAMAFEFTGQYDRALRVLDDVRSAQVDAAAEGLSMFDPSAEPLLRARVLNKLGRFQESVAVIETSFTGKDAILPMEEDALLIEEAMVVLSLDLIALRWLDHADQIASSLLQRLEAAETTHLRRNMMVRAFELKEEVLKARARDSAALGANDKDHQFSGEPKHQSRLGHAGEELH